MLATMPAVASPAIPPVVEAAGEEASLIRVLRGLPGFPGATLFQLEPVAGLSALLRLRSLEIDDLALIVTTGDDVAGLLDRGDIETAAAAMGAPAERLATLFVVTLSRDAGGPRLHVNRRAPIFVDIEHGLAAQIVLQRPDYAVRHPVRLD